MPTYEYRCRACGGRFSAFLPVSERENVTCSCGSREVDILPSWTGGILGGPGRGSPAGEFGSDGDEPGEGCDSCAGASECPVLD